jgi:hypothetical protein
MNENIINGIKFCSQHMFKENVTIKYTFIGEVFGFGPSWT